MTRSPDTTCTTPSCTHKSYGDAKCYSCRKGTATQAAPRHVGHLCLNPQCNHRVYARDLCVTCAQTAASPSQREAILSLAKQFNVPLSAVTGYCNVAQADQLISLLLTHGAI